MAHFETDAEVYDQLGGILNNLVHNSARREQLRQADAVVQFAFREPDATVTLDVRASKTPRIEMGDSKLRADVVLAMAADTGRALLTGELSPTVALARGDVRTKGPVSKVLRLVPATVGAHEVEADLEPEPEPEPAPQAEAAPAAEAAEAATTGEAEAAPAEGDAPSGEAEAAPAEQAEEAAPVDPPAEAEAPAAAAEEPAAAEPEAAPAEEAAEPEAAPAEEAAPSDAEQAAPVDPPAEAEAPADADAGDGASS